jgi:hypothetical protein
MRHHRDWLRATRAAAAARHVESDVAVTPLAVENHLKPADITTYFQSIQPAGQTPMYFRHFREPNWPAKPRDLIAIADLRRA